MSAGAPGPSPAADGEPLLGQAELEALLGDAGHGGDDGMRRVVGAGLVAYERLPMLEIVFDRLMRAMTGSLRGFTGDNVDVSMEGMSSLRFGDYLEGVPRPALLAVFRVEEWDNYGLLVVDSALVYSVVDVLLGGRRGNAAMRVEGRPHTSIERALAERLVSVVLDDLSEAFKPVSPVRFRFERLEVNPRFAAVSRGGNACVLSRFRVGMEDRGGGLELVLPYATLEPVREALLQQFMGEKLGRDSIWETHLGEELRLTELALDVVLDEQTMPLSAVLSLRRGDRITLDASPDAPVKLRCNDVDLFEGDLGRRKDRLAVRITRELRDAAVVAAAVEG
ncbi:flagellar motor switch protein FliM [Craurococcus roseus]|uniref:Flagellar motor switch protein FliM n=1 Tax=Craurococcus roseus TaxID=77585 RepID=A0ABP3PHQ3_9PROT